MSIEHVMSPVDISEDEVILLCEHAPQNNWTHFKRGEISTVLSDGTEIDVDHVALCNDCSELPMQKVKVHVAKRASIQ